MAPGEGSL